MFPPLSSGPGFHPGSNSLAKLAARFTPLGRRLRQNPYYRFCNFQELDQAAQLGFRLDVNQASVDDWLRLPGLSIRQAHTLTQLTQGGVQFHCLEDMAVALGLSLSVLQPLAPVLAFRYYDPGSPTQPPSLQLNNASLEQLCHLPGMTPVLAQAIVWDRHRRGPFRTLADLQQRLGLDPAAIEQLLYYLRV